MNLHAHSCIAPLRIAYRQCASAASHNHSILNQAESLPKPKKYKHNCHILDENHIANIKRCADTHTSFESMLSYISTFEKQKYRTKGLQSYFRFYHTAFPFDFISIQISYRQILALFWKYKSTQLVMIPTDQPLNLKIRLNWLPLRSGWYSTHLSTVLTQI